MQVWELIMLAPRLTYNTKSGGKPGNEATDCIHIPGVTVYYITHEFETHAMFNYVLAWCLWTGSISF